VAGLGWYPCSRLKHSDQCGYSIEKSQAPDDGCINVRNMLSIEDIKLVSYSSTRINLHTHTHTYIYIYI